MGLALSAGCSAQPRTTLRNTPDLRAVAPSARAVTPRKPVALRTVAITLDDLGATAESSAPEISERILRALAVENAPVAVFVNCRSLESRTLRLWQQAGATFGNHTATHLDLDAAGADDVWWRDVETCDARLQGELHERVGFFRYPYLRYGNTAEARETAARRLAGLGYSIAHVTAATSEWLLADYYQRAVESGDAALASELAVAYVAHLTDTLEAARDWAIRKTGQDIRQITLAHVNRLAADHLAEALAALRARGWQFVSLKDALSDPVYSLPDAYTGGCGCSWLARIAPALRPGETYVFGEFEAQIRQRFEQRVQALPQR
jgi:peptidoglycan/xylan/chitin deacetylase (PgdA/CDA1 family)